MNFFRDVVSHLLKNAFEGHTQFSVADDTAVGDNPVRSISLDAVPANENVIVSLSWEGGTKLFEKTLSEKEAAHQFDLISTDLAEVASLTKQGQYDAAKDLMEKLGQKYAENTGEIVETNLPALHNTQASADDKVWKEAKITMQNLWFSTTDELLDYQKKQKGAAQPADQDHIPLWDKNKDKKQPSDSLAPASLSYEDLENKKEREHEDMQDHIDEKIKTELESALQEKAASVFGPDQVELVQILRKNGRNWDEIKKILVKDFGFDKDSTNIFVDEQRQGSDPTGIEVEPVKEEEKPLTPPEELVSPETHDKLLQDHEDKKKAEPPVTEPTFTPKDVMDIPEDEEIQDESALYADEITRADNDEIHKVAKGKCSHPEIHIIEQIVRPGKFRAECWECGADTGFKNSIAEAKKALKTASLKTAGPTDLNPLQEPIQQEPTTPSQDVVPMGKKPLDHNAPQKGDRVFVASDMADEKAGFEGTFISTYKSQGRDQYIVETDDGDLLDVDAHRVSKVSDNGGAQDTEPSMEPVIEQQQPDNEIPVTPKQSDLVTSSLKEAAKRKCDICGEPTHKADAELCGACEDGMKEASVLKNDIIKLAKLAAETPEEQTTFWDERGYDEKYPMMAKHPNMVDPMIEAIKKHPGNWNGIENEMFYKYPYYMMNMSSAAGSRDGSSMITEVENWLKEHESEEDKVFVPRKYEEASTKEASKSSKCVKCDKEHPVADMVSNEHGAGYLCKSHASEWNKDASLKKEAMTTWHDMGMPEPPQAGWKVKHISGLTGTVVDGNEKFADVTLDQPIKPEQLRELNISDVQFQRGDHPKGVYAIYAGDGFGSWRGSTPPWTMTDSGGKPIYPKGYQPPKPMEHDKNPNPEPAIDTESAKQASLEKKASTDYYFTPVSLSKLKKIKGLKVGKGSEGGIVATDGGNYVHLNVDDNGMVDSCTRFGGNDPSMILDLLSSVVGQIEDEHEIQERWNEEHEDPSHKCDENCPLYGLEEDASLKQSYDSLEKGISQPKQADQEFGTKDYPCEECGSPVREAGWSHCAGCNLELEKIEDEKASRKTAAPPTDPTKTQFKDVKITPKYVPKQEATPATPELDAILSKMDALHQNLATLETARQQIQAKMQEEMSKIDQQGERVQMEADLQESVEKAAVLINAVESKIVQWKDKLFTLQTEEVKYVPKLSQKELLAKIYSKFEGAEKYVKDVLNGMLSLGKNVTEKTLYRWPNKKSSVAKQTMLCPICDQDMHYEDALEHHISEEHPKRNKKYQKKDIVTDASMSKEASIVDDMNHFNEELMAALQALSSPI